MSKPLTAKQLLFIQHYATTKNATQSAISAGYKPDNAKVVASQNLSKLNVKEAIDKLLKEELREVKIDRKWAFENLNRMMEGAEGAGQYNASKGLMDSILKMYGLNEAEKVELSGGLSIDIQYNTVEDYEGDE